MREDLHTQQQAMIQNMLYLFLFCLLAAHASSEITSSSFGGTDQGELTSVPDAHAVASTDITGLAQSLVQSALDLVSCSCKEAVQY